MANWNLSEAYNCNKNSQQPTQPPLVTSMQWVMWFEYVVVPVVAGKLW